MASIEIVGLDRTLQDSGGVTHADFCVVRDGEERTVQVLKAPRGWFVTTYDLNGRPTPEAARVDGSFTDAALYGIGIALERPGKTALAA